MKFGPLATGSAAGAILAHTRRAGGRVWKKGRRLDEKDTRALLAAGIESLVVARLETGDIAEDDAAAALGSALASPLVRPAPAFTGRCNLYAETRGLLVADADAIDSINRVDEAMTLATLSPYSEVEAGTMIATAKIIPFAVPKERLEAALSVARRRAPLLRVAPYKAREVGLILTELPGVKATVLERASESQRTRVARYGGTLRREIRCPHRVDELRHAIITLDDEGCDLVLILGASAIVDRGDVVPAALEASGGAIEHLGMPVDPGNLLLLGRRGATSVVGVPGCARSLKPSGFDWVLARLAAELPVASGDLMSMGTGGLLKEMPSRPQPREGGVWDTGARRIGAIVLAAGESKRMPGANKLLCPVAGEPMVTRVVDAVLRAAVSDVVVVTGHEASALRAVLDGRSVSFAHNPDYREGMSSSLRAGITALQGRVDAALVCLGDMPWVGPETIRALVGAFDPNDPRICVPIHNRKRGNPVLWPARFFEAMAQVTGDRGARRLLDEFAEEVFHVPVSDESVNLDIDTPDALEALEERSGPVR